MHYTDLQLDALRELANIGSGTAATALSQMCGRSIDVSVPNALALPIAEAVDAIGAADTPVTAVVIPVFGDLDAVVLLLFQPHAAAKLCGMLGVEPDSEMGVSALGEIGNVLGASYVGALGSMTGLGLEPRPPQTAADMLGAVLSTVVMSVDESGDVALLLDSDLVFEGEECSLSFLLVPSAGGVNELLDRLGVGA
jgi:chemotaxis protein CheC